MNNNNLSKQRQKELADKGWAQMSLLLDEAMPVKKGIGRKWLLLLLLLLLFVVSASYFAYNYSGDVIRYNDKNTKIEKEYVSTMLSDNNEIRNTNSNNDNEKKQRQILNKQTLEVVKTENLTLKDNKISKNNFNKYDISQKQNTKNTYTAQSTKNIIGQEKIIEKTNSHFTNTIIDKPKEKNEIAKVDIFRITTNVEPRLYNISSSPKTNYLNRQFRTFGNKKCGNYKYETGINIISENLKSLGGFEINFNRNFSISKRFEIGTGIEYSFLKKYRTNTSLFRTCDLYGYTKNFHERKGTSAREFNDYFRSPQVLGHFIDELHYLSIPLNLYFKTKKINYLLSLKTSYLVYGKNYTADKQLSLGYNVIINSSDVFYRENIYSKLDYALVLGLDYSLSERLSISTRVNYSFKGIINSPNGEKIYNIQSKREYHIKDRFDRNVYLGIGLKYRFCSNCKN